MARSWCCAVRCSFGQDCKAQGKKRACRIRSVTLQAAAAVDCWLLDDVKALRRDYSQAAFCRGLTIPGYECVHGSGCLLLMFMSECDFCFVSITDGLKTSHLAKHKYFHFLVFHVLNPHIRCSLKLH